MYNHMEGRTGSIPSPLYSMLLTLAPGGMIVSYLCAQLAVVQHLQLFTNNDTQGELNTRRGQKGFPYTLL